MNAMMVRLLAVVILFTAAPAAAQDLGVWSSRAEYADLVSKAGEHATLKDKIATLEAQVATLERRDALRSELEELKDQKYVLQEELTALAREASTYWKERVESEREEARKSVKAARMQGFAGMGMAVGTVVMPGIGTLAGGGIGALLGWLLP